MNAIKKLYCRIFQAAFYLALPLLPYRKPELLEKNEDLETLFRKRGIDRVLMVTDQSVRALGITQPLEKAMKQSGIRLFVYDQTVANPTTDNVEEARAIFENNRCRAIIGFGGGSSIDCAKVVGARIVRPEKSVNRMRGILKIRKKLPLLIAIPTTAGTGSETTLAAVITESTARRKYPINDFSLIPHYAMLDPEVTRTLPKHLTATTGMDALTHAVEVFIGRATTKGTRAAALSAVSMIFKNIDTAYEDGNNMQARRNMLHASFLAGSAFSKSYVGYIHAVAHSLGGRYDVPHGLANAVLMPYVLEAYGECIYPKLHTLGIAAGVAGKADSHETGAQKMIQAIRDKNRQLGIPDKLSWVQATDIPVLARYADKEANPLYPVPKLMEAKELEQFYCDVMEESL